MGSRETQSLFVQQEGHMLLQLNKEIFFLHKMKVSAQLQMLNKVKVQCQAYRNIPGPFLQKLESCYLISEQQTSYWDILIVRDNWKKIEQLAEQ